MYAACHVLSSITLRFRHIYTFVMAFHSFLLQTLVDLRVLYMYVQLAIVSTDIYEKLDR